MIPCKFLRVEEKVSINILCNVELATRHSSQLFSASTDRNRQIPLNKGAEVVELTLYAWEQQERNPTKRQKKMKENKRI